MGQQVEELRGTANLDVRMWMAGIDKVLGSLQKVANEFGRFVDRVATVATAAATAATAGLMTIGMKFNAQMEQAEISFTTML